MSLKDLSTSFLNFSDIDVSRLGQCLNLSSDQIEEFMGRTNQTTHGQDVLKVMNEDACLRNPYKYCTGALKSLTVTYKGLHGYISFVVCLFGIIANVLNVLVLSRREMSIVTINRILTWLAVADILVMVEYIPFSIYMYIIVPDIDNLSFFSAVFTLFHILFSQVIHSILIFLTMTLAAWRYISIRYPEKVPVWCTSEKCRWAIIISYTIPFFLCIPSYLVFHIKTDAIIENSTNTKNILYQLDFSYSAKEEYKLLCKITFWIFGVLIKLLPCVLLTAISYRLIKTLNKVAERRLRLQTREDSFCEDRPQCEQIRRTVDVERKADRVTRLLIAILVLFLLTELPQGIFALLSAALGTCFFRHCYYIFGEVMDLLALFNGSITFLLYFFLNQQFRDTFIRLFRSRKSFIRYVSHASQTNAIKLYG